MAASFNQIVLLGNIGRVEVKTFANGGKIVEASLATSKRWKDRGGETHEDTQWHTLIIGGAMADFVEKYIHKGDQVHASGEMVYRKYTDRNGNERTSAEVRVLGIQRVSPLKDGQQQKNEEEDLPFD